MHFTVVDQRGRTVGQGDDLSELKERLKQRVTATAAQQADAFGQQNLDAFPAEPIPTTRRTRDGAVNVVVYPSLRVVPSGGGSAQGAGAGHKGAAGAAQAAERIDLTALPSAEDQAREHPRAVIHLIDQLMRTDTQQVLAGLPNPTKMAIAQSSYGSAQALLADASLAATAHQVRRSPSGGAVFTPDAFAQLVEQVRAEHAELARTLVLAAIDAVAAHAQVQKAIGRVNSLAVLQQITQLRDHAAALVGPRFISRTPARWLPHLARFEKAALHRVESMQNNPHRDAQHQWEITDLANYWDGVKRTLPAAVRESEAAEDIDWLIEELRVSLFAQQLGTSQTVSDKRIRRAIADLS